MPDELEERLRSHARSFDGLLSLIPAKLYYGEDVSDQWKRKKQTPEQKRAAKMAKLDPGNWKSAKDVMDERAAIAKRKRDEGGPEDKEVENAVFEPERPRRIQQQENHKAKKRRLDDVSQSRQANATPIVEDKKERQAMKKAARREKAQKEREKQQRQKTRKEAEKAQNEEQPNYNPSNMTLDEAIKLDGQTVDDAVEVDKWSTASSSEGAPEIFSPPIESGASSISSIPPSLKDNSAIPNRSAPGRKPFSDPTSSQSQSTNQNATPSSQTLQSEADRDAARARLADAITSFRTARKADNPTSNKPRNRAELLEQRRRKEEARKQAKKEQRRKEREEAALKEDEEIARRFSPGGSGSLLASPRSPPSKESDSTANNFSYGRIEFGDGTKMDSVNLNGVLDSRKKKGPQDVQTALKAAQNKASRLAGLDTAKRAQIKEQDMWLNAKRRAHGERVKDNTSLLKKALRRQEGQKKKSEKEWTDRADGIAKAQEAKQKKRTENIAKRKEDKLAHKVGKKGKKVQKRPGFEGSFRGRTGGKKKS